MVNDYRCDNCLTEFEHDDRISKTVICPNCKQEMRKVYKSLNVLIKCKGTYKGDNK